MQDWIEQNILATCTTWDEIKRRFRQKYDDPNIKNKLIVQLQGCHQAMSARVHQYTEEYQSLVVRVSGGAPIDTFTNINQCERGFIPLIREKLASYRAEQTQRQGFGFEFKTLADLYQAAATIESGLARCLVDSSERNRKWAADVLRSSTMWQDGPITTEPAVNKIEMNARGQPVNVNKKNKPRASSATLSSSSNSSPAPASGGRGGFRGRGGFTRGRGGFRGGRAGRGSYGNSNTSATSSGHTSTPAAQPRGLTQSHTPSGASNFGGECFNCHRRGHRAQDCPLQSNAQSHYDGVWHDQPRSGYRAPSAVLAALQMRRCMHITPQPCPAHMQCLRTQAHNSVQWRSRWCNGIAWPCVRRCAMSRNTWPWQNGPKQ